MKLFRNRGLLILLSVIILNPWWWVILQKNLVAGILVFVLSLFLYFYFWQTKSKRLFSAVLILTIILFVIGIKEAFDESIFRLSALDIQQLNKRHEFYASGLGKLYTNRITLSYFKNFSMPILKLQSNFFGNLDPNLYFFASHPRERVGIEEFEKYLLIFLSFFIIGFIYSIYRLELGLLTYTVGVSFVSSLISPKYNLGPILFFPIINFLIVLGIILSFKMLLKNK